MIAVYRTPTLGTTRATFGWLSSFGGPTVEPITDAVFIEAKTKLHAAITEYYDTVQPGVFVSAWALIAHKQSVELERAGGSAVGVLVPTGQVFPMTRGILEVALDAERRSHWDPDDEPQ